MTGLEGKRAVITGAATGIGRATAELMGAGGARVVIGDINEVEARETVRLVTEAGGSCDFIRADVASEEDVARLVDGAAERLGGLDVIVNNAGVVRCAAVSDVTTQEWDAILAINLRSVFLAVRCGLPHLRAGGGGAIVNTASIAALRPGAGTAPYAASKGAVVALTRELARELGHERIRVNCVCPGWIDTPFNEATIPFLGPDGLEGVAGEIPLGRLGEAAEAAAAIAFLASDSASFITGQMIVVDGGLV